MAQTEPHEPEGQESAGEGLPDDWEPEVLPELTEGLLLHLENWSRIIAINKYPEKPEVRVDWDVLVALCIAARERDQLRADAERMQAGHREIYQRLSSVSIELSTAPEIVRVIARQCRQIASENLPKGRCVPVEGAPPSRGDEVPDADSE